MDIARLSTNISQINTANEVGIKMLDKQLDVQKEEGWQMVKMMEQSVNPNIGSNMDLTV